MGVFVAAPTAGSAGCLPGTVLAIRDVLDLPGEAAVKGMLAAGLTGVFFAEQATFAAEAGGCQVECGAGSGMAAAALCQMMGGSAEECIDAASFALQAVTGLACDNKAEKSDSSHWRIVMAVVAAAALIEDHLLDAGMWRSIADSGSYAWFFGLLGFAATCTFAGISSHRGFSHSFLALALETLSLWLIFPMAAVPFAIAFGTHQLLDITNKKPVRLLYPVKKGFCLGWFYADKLANKLCAALGSAWLAAAIILSLKAH